MHLDCHALLTRAQGLCLHEECVVLCCRLHRHQEALRTLVEDLNDLGRAEMYCRIVMEGRELGSSTPSDPVDEVSPFTPDPPAWAKSIAFAPRKGAPAAVGPTTAEEHPACRREGRPRPLMLLLKVLLDACVGAAQRPAEYRKVSAEYRDAALSLLMCYAGLCDLPPSDVIGVVPDDWTLEFLAPYLSKCARLCLHGQRSSLLEESLSSMAYLKTFAAWATERMRKVSISGDRCCPVCNRRFVDKDLVGKAFVAYPNETCVHLQCKEDLSVCPKTGRSFADNLSVFCHALRAGPSVSSDLEER